MCGIAGRVSARAPVARAELDAMSALVAHRGPDGAGVWIEGGAGLAHRRLAIVDLAGGRQPVAGESGRVVLVYNGEVYNHLELRPALEARGHVFADRCDTEAVLHAHEEWGAGAAPRLRGMFAYAAWDREARRLTLVRDHLGIKPLYYAHLPSGDLLFASELKALLVAPEVDRALDDEALGAYLALRYVPAPATLLRGVRKLEPGCALVWHDGRVETARWWAPPVATGRGAPPTWAEAAGRLCALLDEVVGAWRMADVPLGTFLSGGVDSTLVTAILARLARRAGDPAPQSYAVGYGGVDAGADDELAWAALAARALGTRHSAIRISGAEVAAALPRIAWDLDEPLGDPAAVSLWFLARHARTEVTIALSGEGADEVFGGYAAYGRLLGAERLRRLPGVVAAARALQPHLAGRWARVARFLAAPPDQAYRGVARALDDAPWGRPGAAERALAPSRARARSAPDLLGRLLAFDQEAWLADDLLVKADKMTMAHALELRPPLLDVRLLEELAGWPSAWKHDGRVGKKILRRAASGLVPQAVLDRPKIGFGTPSGAWLRGPLASLTRDLLCGPESLAADRGGRARIEALLDEHAHGRDRANELWALLALESWRHAVAVGVDPIRAGPGLEMAG
jgi:asparagine synthase (glutamine-hydrolysing)